ncbi:unnamed protein product [Gemmataceae bacterium]|nr:unnamed protein product [Gemmataceae bacterium]VTU02816.1 unnamed protein product [Gemmataceae bacterium]
MVQLKWWGGACAVAVVLAAAGVAHASGATFAITAEGAKLGAPEDGDIPKYTLKVDVGQTVTLAAQGMVLPRGGNPAPAEPDAAAWLFDDAAFQLQPLEKEKADKTKAVVVLKALKPGTTKVRFVGNILGYERKYDVVVEVAAEKK